MITTFEVASIFKIRDEATATLTRMAEKVTEFNAMVKEARENLAGMGRLRLSGLDRRLQGLADQAAKVKTAFGSTFTAMDTQVTTAIAEVRTLAEQWRAVATAAAATTRATRGVGIGNPRQRVMGHTGGGGVHVSSLPVPFPGGHARVRIGNNAAAAGAGILGYAAFEEAKFEDAAFRAMYTAGVPDDPVVRRQRTQELRKLIQSETIKTGAPVSDIEESVLTGLRQFAGMPWEKRIEIMPDLIEAAAAESRLKPGSTVNEGMEVFTGLAHMIKQYSPEKIKNLIPKFAYLSVVDPEKIKQISRAASYAVPITQSSLDVDPFDTLLLTAALQRSGVSNTKSGTWIREMAVRAMPGTSLMSKTAFKKHEFALHELGLVDEKGNPTWFTGGKPDLIKMLDIAGSHLKSLPLTERAAIERQLYGAQGSGAFSVLSDPTVLKQLHTLRDEMVKFKTGASFFQEYEKESPIQQFRDAWATSEVVLMDIGTKVLPPLVLMLEGFDGGLKQVQKTLGGGVLGTIITAGLGAYAGGKLGGTPGALIGAVGAVAAQNTVTQPGQAIPWYKPWEYVVGTPYAFVPEDRLKAAQAASGAAGDKRPIQVTTILNVDGQKLAQAVTQHIVRDASGPAEGTPYHDATYSTAPLDFALPF